MLVLAAWPRSSEAQDQYKSIDAADLIKSPQKYWARPIVFKDTLIDPPKSAGLEIENKRYAIFSTREVGTCYASADLLPEMSRLETNREYLFSGTVFQNRGRYVPVVQSYTPAIDTRKLSKDIQSVVEETSDNSTNQSIRPMADLLAAVQSAQLAYAKENNIPLCQLYDPTSEHFVKALDIARTAIYNSEQKNNTASAEILAQYLSTVLAKQCPPAMATQLVATTEPEPPSHDQEMPAQVLKRADITNTTPARQSKETNPAEITNLVPQTHSESHTADTAKLQQPNQKITSESRALETSAESRAAEAARKAAAEYNALQKPVDLSSESTPEPFKPAALIQVPEPASNTTNSTTSTPRKSTELSWFQRWKLEHHKRAVIKAELRRIDQARKEEARRLAAEKKAEQRERAEKQKEEARKVQQATTQRPSPDTTTFSTNAASGNSIYLPMSR